MRDQVCTSQKNLCRVFDELASLSDKSKYIFLEEANGHQHEWIVEGFLVEHLKSSNTT